MPVQLEDSEVLKLRFLIQGKKHTAAKSSLNAFTPHEYNSFD